MGNYEEAVLIVHGNALFRHGLQHVLGQAGVRSEVVRVTGGAAAVTAAVSDRIERGDVRSVVVDASLALGGALGVLAAGLHADDPVPVVLVLDPADTGGFPWGFFAAAVACTDDGGHVLEAIESVEAGLTFLDPRLAPNRGVDDEHAGLVGLRGLSGERQFMLLTDFDENARIGLRHLQADLAMNAWMVNRIEDDTWTICRAADLLGRELDGHQRPLDETFCGRMISGVVPHVVPDVAAERGLDGAPALRDVAHGSYMGVPIVLPCGEVYGTVCGIHRTPIPVAVLEAHLPHVEHLADVLGALAGVLRTTH